MSNIKCVIVDLMMNMRPETNKTEIGSYSHVVYLSKNLKALALQYDVAIFPILQYNRDGSKNKEDVNSYNRRSIYDIKGGSDIEQDCDIIIQVHPTDDYSKKEIEFAKHRDGERKSVFIDMNPATMKIRDTSSSANAAMQQAYAGLKPSEIDIEDDLPF
jgi:replicative DNA helicase